MPSGEEYEFTHILLEAMSGLLALLVAIGGWIMKGLSDKIAKHDEELFDPEGALRMGDEAVKRDTNTIMGGVTKEMKGLRRDIGQLRTDLAVATGGKIMPPRVVDDEDD